MSHQFSGTGVAIATPFKADKSIDFDALANLLEHIIQGQVEYIVALGSTGEAPAVSSTEKKEVLDFVIQTVAGRRPIVAGFSNNHTQALLEEIKQYDFNGIDAILCSSPHYNKPSQEGIFQHYKAVAAISPVPIIVYNVPGRTSSNINAATTVRLANEFSNIIAIKEASGDLSQCMEIRKQIQRADFALLSGDDLLALPLIASGFDGVISVVANAWPFLFSDLIRTARAGNIKKAQKSHYLLMDFINLLFTENNPAGLKAALSIMGICSENLRLPLVPVSDTLREAFKKEIKVVSVSQETKTT